MDAYSLQRKEIQLEARGVTFPASLFGIVLGLVGLGNAWRDASHLWQLPPAVGEALMTVAAIVWLALIAGFSTKWIRRPEEARAEIAHPVQCCFVSLVQISTMLMAAVLLPYSRASAVTVFVVGAVATLLFGVWRHGGLWKGNRDIKATTPVLYLPTVAANFVTAIVASALGWAAWGQLFLGAGLFAWLALESTILQRLFNAEELQPALRPTLGIGLAPPAVGLLAYSSVVPGPPTLLSGLLLGYALLQALLLLRLLPWIAQQPFGPGYWGFTFGLTAVSLGVQRMAERGGGSPFVELAPILFVVANLVTGWLAVMSLLMLAKGRFLPQIPAAG